MHADHDNHPMPGPSHPINPANPVPTLEEKVDCLSDQFAHLMEAFMYAGGQNQPQPQPHHDEEVDDFLSHHEEEPRVANNGKVCLPKFAMPQTFDGTMKDTKSFFIFFYLLCFKVRFGPVFRP